MNSYSFQFDFHPGTDAPPVPAVYNIAYDGRFELTYAYNVTWTGTANRLIYTVAGTGNSPAPSYLFANTAGVLNPYYSERGTTILVRLSNSAVRAEKTFTVTLVDATTGATAAVTSAILANAPPIDPRTNDIGLTGTHTQYVVAETQNGQLSIQDTVAGRDGTRTVAKPGLIRFADGTGIFDPIGNAQSNRPRGSTRAHSTVRLTRQGSTSSRMPCEAVCRSSGLLKDLWPPTSFSGRMAPCPTRTLWRSFTATCCTERRMRVARRSLCGRSTPGIAGGSCWQPWRTATKTGLGPRRRRMTLGCS